MTLKLWIFSDLHLDYAPVELPLVEHDVILIAGDTQNDNLLGMLGEHSTTYFVAGNHEFYGHEYPTRLDQLANLDDAVLLENQTCILPGGARLIGATLWTDYDLYHPEMRSLAMNTARGLMNDHRKITWRKNPWERFRPQEARALHQKSRAFIEDELTRPHAGPTIVMTHHAPHIGSIHERYSEKIINAAYASDLESLILEHQPDLWIHGHVHSSFDYQVGKTRVLCNPRGYADENPDFNPSLVVEL